jgi:hypothetical protein
MIAALEGIGSVSLALERSSQSIVMAAWLAATAAALAAFTSPVNLTGPGRDAVNPRVAIDAAGDSIAIWERSDGTNFRLQTRPLPAAGSPGPTQTLSPAGQDAFSPTVAADSDGDALAAWVRSDGTNLRVEGRQVTAAGARGPVLALSAAGHDASSPVVATDAGGDSIVTWYRSDGTNDRIEARTVSAAGVIGTVLTLSGAGQNATSPEVATDADGDSVVAWYRFDGANWRVQARSVSAAGVMGPIRTLSGAGHDAYAPEVATDSDGNAIVVWERYLGAPGYRILERQMPAGGAFGATQTLSTPGQSSFVPEVASDAGGDAVVAWGVFDGTNDLIQARQVSAAGALGPTRTLSAAGQDAFSQQVSIDGGGSASITWVRLDGAHSRVQARPMSSAAVLGATETLSAGGHDAVGPQLATDQGGDAIAAWQRSDGTNFRIQGATGP